MSGSAGSVIANRLTENENWKVLLIEAGGDPSFASDIPAFLFSLQGSPMDWSYFSEKSDKACLGMIDERCHYPRGKALGGSSSINAMLYVRGNPEDFNEWEKLGNPGWNYENVLQYFKKAENLVGFSLLKDEEYDEIKRSRRSAQGDFERLWELSKSVSEAYHSLTGYLSVGHYGHDYMLNQFKNLVFDAVEEAGLSYVPDINGKNQIGFTQSQGTLHDGKRANVAKMYLSPIKDRKNLFVVKNALVKKILIENKKVTGVELIRNGETKIVSAKKEVILSAGAINSPQLLMVSGIGPKDHLDAVGVPLVHDLPGVGRNLQDHVIFIGAPFSVNKPRARPIPPLQQLDSMYEYLTRGTGIFSTIGMTDVIGFVNTQNSSDIPDVQYHFLHTPIKDDYLINEVLRSLHFNDDVKKQYLKIVEEAEYFTICPTLLRPKSRGKIELNSGDILDAPKIYTNFLENSEDAETLLRGLKIVLKIMNTNYMQYLEPELVRLDLPKCKDLDFKSDEYWRCLLKYVATSLFHPVGTCKMGPDSDPKAVVDSKLKLHGIEGLRVADASIMPVIVRGNTNAATVMIGEMASDLIKSDWNAIKHSEL